MDGSPVADSRRSRVLRDQQMNVEFTMSRMGNQARTIHLMVFGIIISRQGCKYCGGTLFYRREAGNKTGTRCSFLVKAGHI